jgi:spermidine synthase
MGGTFPLLVKQFTGPGDVGPTAGWLYAVNTGGAALGCYLAGFHLLPWLGLSGTNFLAASLNVAIAAGAFLLARRTRSRLLPNLPPLQRTDTIKPAAAFTPRPR